MQHEIGIILKVRNLQQTKREIDGLFDGKATTRVKGYNDKLKNTEKTTKKTSVATKNLKTSVRGFLTTVGLGAATLAVFNRSLEGSLRLFNEGAGLERINRSFQNIAGGNTEALESLRRATKGTVDDLNLMNKATMAVTQGVGLKNLPRLLQMATTAAEKLNISMDASTDAVLRGVAQLDQRALKSLGIVLETNKAYQAQMAVLGKVGSVAKSVAQIDARRNFILAELSRVHGQFNANLVDSKTLIDQFRASSKNLTQSLGVLMTIGLKPLIKVLISGANSVKSFVDRLGNDKQLTLFFQKLSLAAVGVGALTAALVTARLAMMLFSGSIMGPIALLGGLIVAGAALNSDISKLTTGFRVFFDLVKNFDSKTGKSFTSERMAKSLGSTYEVIISITKGFLLFGQAAKGFLIGLADAAAFVGDIFGGIFPLISEAFRAISDGKPLTREMLNTFKDLGRWVGRLVIPLTAAGVAIASMTAGVFALKAALAALTASTIYQFILKLGDTFESGKAFIRGLSNINAQQAASVVLSTGSGIMRSLTPEYSGLNKALDSVDDVAQQIPVSKDAAETNQMQEGEDTSKIIKKISTDFEKLLFQNDQAQLEKRQSRVLNQNLRDDASMSRREGN